MDASLQQYLEEILRQMATDPKFMERKSGGTPGGIQWIGPRDQPGAMNLKALESLLTMSEGQEKRGLDREQLKNSKDIAGMTMAGQLGAQSMREKTLDDRQLRTYMALRSKLAARMQEVISRLQNKDLDDTQKQNLMAEGQALKDQLDFIEAQIAGYQPEKKPEPEKKPDPDPDNPVRPDKLRELAKGPTRLDESAMSGGQPGGQEQSGGGFNLNNVANIGLGMTPLGPYNLMAKRLIEKGAKGAANPIGEMIGGMTEEQMRPFLDMLRQLGMMN